jgi:hypothetical protein
VSSFRHPISRASSCWALVTFPSKECLDAAIASPPSVPGRKTSWHTAPVCAFCCLPGHAAAQCPQHSFPPTRFGSLRPVVPRPDSGPSFRELVQPSVPVPPAVPVPMVPSVVEELQRTVSDLSTSVEALAQRLPSLSVEPAADPLPAVRAALSEGVATIVDTLKTGLSKLQRNLETNLDSMFAARFDVASQANLNAQYLAAQLAAESVSIAKEDLETMVKPLIQAVNLLSTPALSPATDRSSRRASASTRRSRSPPSSTEPPRPASPCVS